MTQQYSLADGPLPCTPTSSASPAGLYRVGRDLINSRSAKRQAKGIEALRRAAKLGSVGANEWLGAAYDYGCWGVAQDPKRSFTHYMYAAKAGSRGGEYHVGIFHLMGRGTARNHREAVDWLRRAARKHDPDAMDALGDCYRYGKGVRRDPKKGFDLQLRAAKSGSALAKFSVSVAYSRGEGVAANKRKAFE